MTQTRAEKLNGVTERRSVSLVDNFEMRASEDAKTIAFNGHPSLFNVEYEMYGGPDKGGWIESVDPQAFKRTLGTKPDVVLNMNHGMAGTGLPIARTSSGTLTVGTDSKGLVGDAPSLDLRDPDVQALQVKTERGDLTQMSFAFRTIRQEWNDDESRRILLELSLDNGDISIVTNGASPTTTFELKGLDHLIDALAAMDPEEAELEVRALAEDTRPNIAGAHALLTRLLPKQTAPAEVRATLSLAKARRLALMDA